MTTEKLVLEYMIFILIWAVCLYIILTLFNMEHLWKRELVLDLIKEWRQHEHLYDSSHRKYTSKFARTHSLRVIYNILKKSQPKITLEMIRKKMHTLRTQFCKERKLYLSFKKSRKNSDEIYEPKLWCYDNLAFLKPFANVYSRKFLSNPSIRKQFINNDVNTDESAYEVEINMYDKRNQKKEVDFSKYIDETTESLKIGESDEEAVPFCDGQYFLQDDSHDGYLKEVIDSSVSNSANKNTASKNSPSIVKKVNYNSISTTIKKLKSELLQITECRYTWLGEHVINEMNKIEDEYIVEDAICKIQLILKKSLSKSREISLDMDPFATDVNL